MVCHGRPFSQELIECKEGEVCRKAYQEKSGSWMGAVGKYEKQSAQQKVEDIYRPCIQEHPHAPKMVGR